MGVHPYRFTPHVTLNLLYRCDPRVLGWGQQARFEAPGYRDRETMERGLSNEVECVGDWERAQDEE